MGSRLDQQFQRGAAVIKDAVNGVKDRRLPTESVPIRVGPGIDVGSSLKENSCALDAIELCADVQRCDALTRSEGTGYSQFAVQVFPRVYETLDSRVIV